MKKFLCAIAAATVVVGGTTLPAQATDTTKRAEVPGGKLFRLRTGPEVPGGKLFRLRTGPEVPTRI